jgi:hypothetical protein
MPNNADGPWASSAPHRPGCPDTSQPRSRRPWSRRVRCQAQAGALTPASPRWPSGARAHSGASHHRHGLTIRQRRPHELPFVPRHGAGRGPLPRDLQAPHGPGPLSGLLRGRSVAAGCLFCCSRHRAKGADPGKTARKSSTAFPDTARQRVGRPGLRGDPRGQHNAPQGAPASQQPFAALTGWRSLRRQGLRRRLAARRLRRP